MHSRCRHKIVMQKKEEEEERERNKTGGGGGGEREEHTYIICKHVMHFMADCLTI